MNEPKPKVALKHGYPDQQATGPDAYGQSRIFPLNLPRQVAVNTVIQFNPSGRRYRLHAMQIQYQNTGIALTYDALVISFNGTGWAGPVFIQGPYIQGGLPSRWMSGFIHGPAPFTAGAPLITGITDMIVYSFALPAIDWDGDVIMEIGSASGGSFTFLNPMLFIEFLPG